MVKKFFLVEDHGIMRRSICKLLEREPDFRIFDEAATAEEALEKLAEIDAKPDMMLLDISLPEMSGLELLAEIQKRWPDIPCAMLSGSDASVYYDMAMEAGAQAFIPKHSVRDIVPMIRSTLEGIDSQQEQKE